MFRVRRGPTETKLENKAFVLCYIGSNKLEVVLADLGCAVLVSPADRFPWAARPPDLLWGCQRFGPDLDLWSLGCLAAELFLREPPFQVKRRDRPERSILNAHFALLGTPTTGASTHAWMKSLPFVAGFYGSAALELPAQSAPEWPPARLRDCQPIWADFVRQTLQWQPQALLTAASPSRR